MMIGQLGWEKTNLLEGSQTFSGYAIHPLAAYFTTQCIKRCDPQGCGPSNSSSLQWLAHPLSVEVRGWGVRAIHHL